MVPHLQNILEPMDLHLVMPAVLDQWFFSLDGEWTTADLHDAIRYPGHLEDRSALTYDRARFMETSRDTGLFPQLLHYTHVLTNAAKLDKDGTGGLPRVLYKIWERVAQNKLQGIGFPIPFRQINKLLEDPTTSQLGEALGILLLVIWKDSSTESQFLATSMRDVAQYIVASSNKYTLHGIAVANSSPLPRSESQIDLVRQMHLVLIHRKILTHRRDVTSEEDVDQWIEAIDVVRCAGQLRPDFFEAIPGYFPTSLLRLEKDLNSLSLVADIDFDFQYLNSFREHWDKADPSQRERLVCILSQHINNYPQGSDPDTQTGRNDTTDSPLVWSWEGLGLIAFIASRLERETGAIEALAEDIRSVWRAALDHIRGPESPDDTDASDSDSDPSQVQEAIEIESDGRDSSTGSRHNIEEIDESEKNGPRISELIRGVGAERSSPDMGARSDQAEHVDIVSEDVRSEIRSGNERPRSRDDLASTGGKQVGGPDADNNV
ncbi:hypothetical protein AAF712_013787 [Marasmius tenuissimus]|uniref:Uncharacterized protein n=1 Tax=Marasmius tenuissimus TaxID=585030 RepID=A0ABR2ZDR0_9AGAR